MVKVNRKDQMSKNLNINLSTKFFFFDNLSTKISMEQKIILYIEE